jgi:hypothetical protein
MTFTKYRTIKIPITQRTAKCSFCKNGATHVVIAHFKDGVQPTPAICGKHLKQFVKELENVLKKQRITGTKDSDVGGM